MAQIIGPLAAVAQKVIKHSLYSAVAIPESFSQLEDCLFNTVIQAFQVRVCQPDSLAWSHF
jgi:hypothetical protein